MEGCLFTVELSTRCAQKKLSHRKDNETKTRTQVLGCVGTQMKGEQENRQLNLYLRPRKLCGGKASMHDANLAAIYYNPDDYTYVFFYNIHANSA